MTLSTVSDRWRCYVRQCRQEIGLRKGTWLERSRMESRTVILFIYCWSQNLATIKFCYGHTIAVDWKNFLREICAWQLLQTPTIVGGPGLPASLPAQSSFPICGHHTKELKRWLAWNILIKRLIIPKTLWIQRLELIHKPSNLSGTSTKCRISANAAHTDL